MDVDDHGLEDEGKALKALLRLCRLRELDEEL